MNDETKMTKENLGWDHTVVMVCTKCGKQFRDTKFEGAPERIKDELKAASKSQFGKSVRVVNTTCLNICPVNKVAIAVASSREDKNIFEAYSVPPESSGAEIFEKILK